MVGRTPRKVADPAQHLTTMAARAPLPAGRPPLGDPVLLAQVVWSVTSRVGLDAGPMPAFDPAGLSARERWLTLVDVRAAADRVLRALSHGLGVELTASPLPRVDASDDREVAPTRRNYLSPADVRGLPVGVWVESGPYSRGEWLARGVAGAAGRAAHLRVNERSYLAVYEARSGAMWRLETTGRGAHHGLVAEGTAESFDDAKQAVRQALRDRFPDAARAVDADVSAPVTPHHGWVPLPGGRDARTEGRVFDERVSATVSARPGRPLGSMGHRRRPALAGAVDPDRCRCPRTGRGDGPRRADGARRGRSRPSQRDGPGTRRRRHTHPRRSRSDRRCPAHRRRPDPPAGVATPRRPNWPTCCRRPACSAPPPSSPYCTTREWTPRRSPHWSPRSDSPSRTRSANCTPAGA